MMEPGLHREITKRVTNLRAVIGSEHKHIINTEDALTKRKAAMVANQLQLSYLEGLLIEAETEEQ